ncbi:thioesterase family protein [Novosphingobium sp.]|uniref:thioesterase family protein n=1 Tax=Novosphingobium sp. TaxID=1874826 RepID=UPI003D131DEF
MDQGQFGDTAVPLSHLAQALVRDGDRFTLHGAAGWMQGRTMYGGASSFIAYVAAQRAFPDLPPLRAAQIGFIGPVGEDIEARVTMLRTGKSVSHVETTLWCEGALAFRATWLFGRARPGNGHNPAARLDGIAAPETSEPVAHSPMTPAFIERMDLRQAGPRGGDGRMAIRRWVRLKDREGLDPYAEMIAIGDTLPPGSIRAIERPGPLSSINWSLTVLGEDMTTRDGWWLLETESNHLADGFSSETLRMWNTDGVEVMRGLQSVAIFGSKDGRARA